MKHLVKGTQLAPAAEVPHTERVIPWSEERETFMLRWDGYAVILQWIIAFVIAMELASAHFLMAAAAGVAVAILFAARAYVRSELAAMMHNRPRAGSTGLTRWHWHNHLTSQFICACGEARTFEGSTFYQNSVDPGGGRYAYVCPCGRGHFKFRTVIKTGERGAGNVVSLFALFVVLGFCTASFYPGGIFNRHDWLSAHSQHPAMYLGQHALGLNQNNAPLTLEVDGKEFSFDVCLAHGELRRIKK